MIVESYSKDWSKLMEYYKFDGKPVSHFPFNFRLINHMTKESTADDWENEIKAWYLNEGTQWANWVVNMKLSFDNSSDETQRTEDWVLLERWGITTSTGWAPDWGRRRWTGSTC
jgi:hypothetical protein